MKTQVITILFFFAAAKLCAQCAPAYGFNSRKIQVDSMQVNYVEAGKGKTLVMIHGLGGNASHWKRNMEHLSENYRCVAIDLPGYGNSDPVSRMDAATQLDFYAETVAAVLKKLKVSTAIVMGHSMGGQVAMILALKHPLLVEKLVLVAPAGLETFTVAEAGLLTTYATAAFYEKQDSAAIQKSYQLNFFRMPDLAQQLVRERIALKLCPGFTAYCRQIPMGVKGMLGHPVKDKLTQISQPVLVLFGEQDALIPNKLLHPSLTVRDIAAVANRIPAATVQLVPEAGHLLQYEKPEAVNEAVIHFLRNTKPL